jgi:hypothetical protein
MPQSTKAKIVVPRNPWSLKAKLWFMIGILAVILSIYISVTTNPRMSRKKRTKQSIQSISPKEQFKKETPRIVRKLRRQFTEGTDNVTLVTIPIGSPEEIHLTVAKDGNFSLIEEIISLRNSTEIIYPTMKDRKGRSVNVIDLAVDIQETILTNYRYGLDQYSLLAFRKGKKKDMYTRYLFALHNESIQVSNNNEWKLKGFDHSKLTTEKDIFNAKQIDAKVFTYNKQNILNFTFAYILALLSSIGNKFTFSDGSVVDGVAVATGYIDLTYYTQLIMIDSKNETALLETLKLFDKSGRKKSSLPKNNKNGFFVRSVYPLQEKSHDSLIIHNNTAWIEHIWTTVTAKNLQSNERKVYQIDLSSMQYDIYDNYNTGLFPYITDNDDLYITRHLIVPEESIMEKGTYIFKVFQDKAEAQINDVIDKGDERKFIELTDRLIKKWDPDYYASTTVSSNTNMN